MRAMLEILLVLLPLTVATIAVAKRENNALSWGIGVGIPATLAAISLATWGLGNSGLNWTAVGLSRPETSWKFALWCLAAIVLVSASMAIVKSVAARAPGVAASRVDRFVVLRGHPCLTVAAIVGIWIVSAFGEELIFRGYLLNRLEAMFPIGALGLTGAVVLSSAAFGALHWGHGPSAAARSTAAGVAYATVYLLSGRSLWVTVIAHGVIDSLAIVSAVCGKPRGAT
jgi:membrane protease YdiL (CAAX protease family)